MIISLLLLLYLCGIVNVSPSAEAGGGALGVGGNFFQESFTRQKSVGGHFATSEVPLLIRVAGGHLVCRKSTCLKYYVLHFGLPMISFRQTNDGQSTSRTGGTTRRQRAKADKMTFKKVCAS